MPERERLPPSHSLLKPRRSLVDAAFEYAATAPVALPTNAGPAACLANASPRVAWSVAEAVLQYAEVPIEPRPGCRGPGIFVEKSLVDAYLPLNFTISMVVAGANACVAEAMRTNLIDSLVPEPDDDDGAKPDVLPWNWALVLKNTIIQFARETIGLTLLRAIEILSKPRLAANNYRSVLKQVPKLAKYTYQQQCKTCASKWTASWCATKGILVSPTFFALRAKTGCIADLLVDGVLWYRGQLTDKEYASNIKLKILKHSVTGVLSLATGGFVPFIYAHPWTFILTDLGASSLADLVVGKFGTIV